LLVDDFDEACLDCSFSLKLSFSPNRSFGLNARFCFEARFVFVLMFWQRGLCGARHSQGRAQSAVERT